MVHHMSVHQADVALMAQLRKIQQEFAFHLRKCAAYVLPGSEQLGFGSIYITPQVNKEVHTAHKSVCSVALAEERVQFDHFLHSRLGESFLRDNLFNLLSKRRNPFRMCCESEQAMRPSLRYSSSMKV